MSTSLIVSAQKAFDVPQLATEALVAQHSKTLEQVRAFAVTTAEDSQFLTEVLTEAKTAAKGLEDTRTSFVKPFNDTVKAINAEFGTVIGVLTQIENTGKASIAAWTRAENERIRQEQIKRDAAAAAERQRLADEAAAATAAAAQVEAKAMENPDTPQADAALQQAQDLRQTAAVAQVEAMNTHAAPVQAARIRGASVRENWQAELVDIGALIKYLVDHPEYQNLLVLDSTVARNLVRVQKGNCQIPGLRVWDASTVSIRTRRAA